MMENMLDAVGRTPLVELGGLTGEQRSTSRLFAKLEMFNPTGSVTDRTALALICDGERRGLLHRGSTVIEAVGGNMGVSVAYVCRLLGYRCVLYAPENISEYNTALIRALGAKLILTPRKRGIAGAVARADEAWKKGEDCYFLRQFSNDAAAEGFRRSLGPELKEQLGADIDVLVCAVGSGATLSGTAEFLSSWMPGLRVIAVEPKESPVLCGSYPAPHGIDGIGVDFVPENYNPYIVDTVMAVATGDALEMARRVFASDGVFCGISSGAALFAALQLCGDSSAPPQRIAVVLPDGGCRYARRLFPNDDAHS